MPDADPQPFDAVLLVSFGGPERPEDVLPFLENVARGKPIPRQRLLEVAEHYHQFGGKSPINDQNRALIGALEAELASHGLNLPIYWGNRNWRPLLTDALAQMGADGVRRALALFTSAFSSYSSCRQYLENIAAAQAELGPTAPRVDKLRAFYNHPGFIAAMTQCVREAFGRVPADGRAAARLLYTAHSIPLAMAANCRYEAQLLEACRLVSQGLDRPAWDLVYQSRSGPPTQPWLEPDVADRLRELAAAGVRDVVLAPIGFVSDHLEVHYDLDTEARRLCGELGVHMVRAATVGTHPRVIAMYRELIQERIGLHAERPALGPFGPSHDVCAADCCLSGRRYTSRGRK
ncbi:MAG TPA: ferrochelatase [Pirellulales bacterium]|nr:ferrochelatase [Pirellulales bacterium]